jgi:hypothetical protein
MRFNWLVAAGVLVVSSFSPAIAASDLLTRGEVYRLVNQAQLLPNNRPARAARLSDVMVPQDAIRTLARSRAELLFNEGSLARIGSNGIFRFIPGMRGFQLRNGVALIMSLPNSAATRIEALEGQVVAEIPPIPPNISPPSPNVSPASAEYQNFYKNSSTLLMVADAKTGSVEAYNLTLTNITLKDSQGNIRILRSGETVTFSNGKFGEVKQFNLQKLHQTSQLAIGLGIGQEKFLQQESPPVQRSLTAVRVATIAALNLQQRTIEGLCTLNARGGSSTLSTNCITTDSDDPLRVFQDRRDITPPRQDRTPPGDVTVPIPPPPQTPPPQTPPPQTPPPQTPPPQTPPPHTPPPQTPPPQTPPIIVR